MHLIISIHHHLLPIPLIALHPVPSHLHVLFVVINNLVSLVSAVQMHTSVGLCTGVWANC